MGAPSLRTCVGCRARRERPRLIRLQADGEGRLTVSRHGGAGRGIYLCPASQCLALALARKSPARALRRPGLTVDPEALGREFAAEMRRRVPTEGGTGC